LDDLRRQIDIACLEATRPAMLQAQQAAIAWLQNGPACIEGDACDIILRLVDACLAAGLTAGSELQDAMLAVPQVRYLADERRLAVALSIGESQARLWQWPQALATVEHALTQAQPSSTSNVVFDLEHMRARALRELGRSQEALEPLIALRSRLLRDHATDSQRVLVVTTDLAAVHREVGNLPAARLLDESRLPLVMARFGIDSAEAALVEGSLGQTLSLQGDDAEASRLLESAWMRLSQEMDHGHPQVLAARSALAAVLWRMGRTSDALTHDLELARAQVRVFGPQHPIARASLANLAQSSTDLGEDAAAVNLLSQLVDACRLSFGAAHPATLRARANLGQALTAQGAADQAAHELGEAAADADVALGPLHSDALSILYRRGQALAAAGDANAACSVAIDLLQKLAAAAPVGDDWFIMADESLSFLVRQAAPTIDWAHALRLSATLSPAMRDELSLRPVESSTQALQRYEQFHNAWAQLALQRDPLQLPQALRALHAAPSVRLSLQSLGEAGPDLSHWRYAIEAVHDARRSVRTCEAELAGGGASTPAAEPGAVGDLRQTSRAFADRELVRHVADERAAINRLRQLRNELATRCKKRWALQDAGGLTFEDLQQGLTGHSAVVVVFENQNHGWALIVRASEVSIVPLGEPLTRSLPKVHAPAFSQRNHRGAEPVEHQLDCRNTAAAEGNEVTSPLGLAEIVRQAFWVPLLERLRGADEVLIVLGPGHYSLPIEVGNPGVRAGYFLGLPSFLEHIKGAKGLPVPRNVGVVCAAALDSRRPIPFAEAEVDALRLLQDPTLEIRSLKATDLMQPIAADRAVQTLSIACHGGTSGALSGRFGRLVLEPDSNLGLSPSELSGWLATVSEVYLSACVGGVSSTVVGGGPLGLVSEWQVRGCQAVVAFLAPIHDFYAPLLCAGYWHQRALGAQPSEALHQAKSDLLIDRLPIAVWQSLRSAYRSTMARLLEEVVEAVTCPDRVPHAVALLRSVSGWPLPAAVRASYFSLNIGGGVHPQDSELPADQRAFVQAMADPAERELLLVQVLSRVLPAAGSARRPDECNKEIEHLCSMVVLFGR
jgi:hypothetical protein